MAKRENDIFKIKDLIPGMLKENKLQKGMDQILIKEAWEDIMGKGVVTYTESVFLQKSTLIVKLSSAPLREELSYGIDKIVKMMNDQLIHISIKKVKLI